VISTAGDALLSVSDPSTDHTGRLMKGSFFLPQPLQASASSLGGMPAAGGVVGGSSAPTSLLTYGGPVSNDSVALTFTLSTTTP
jgi:hypothetical protein